MTRLGAKKKRERLVERFMVSEDTWTYVGDPDIQEGDVIVFSGENGMMATGTSRKVVDAREYTEEEVRTACEWTLAFMLLFRNKNSARFGITCMEMAFQYPAHSYRYEFWWAARNFCRGYSLSDFRTYLNNKLLDIKEGFLHRDGPVW